VGATQRSLELAAVDENLAECAIDITIARPFGSVFLSMRSPCLRREHAKIAHSATEVPLRASCRPPCFAQHTGASVSSGGLTRTWSLGSCSMGIRNGRNPTMPRCASSGA
jgi:hypothetical protein